MIPGSTSLEIENKQYADDNGIKAIEAALKRRGLDGRVEKDTMTQFYKVSYKPKKEPKAIKIKVKRQTSNFFLS